MLKTSTKQSLSLEEETKIIIEEARMVLPGIQSLFGFQLIAVFNNRFQNLTGTEQAFHFIALLMVAVAIALIMTPAAYNTTESPQEVPSRVNSWILLPVFLNGRWFRSC
jgi:hypothetical protein